MSLAIEELEGALSFASLRFAGEPAVNQDVQPVAVCSKGAGVAAGEEARDCVDRPSSSVGEAGLPSCGAGEAHLISDDFRLCVCPGLVAAEVDEVDGAECLMVFVGSGPLR